MVFATINYCMKKYLTAEELGKVINVSVRTIRRAVEKGLPVAKTQTPKTGGKKQNLFNLEDVKVWYIDQNPNSKTAKHILGNCPPKEIKKVKQTIEKKAKAQAIELSSEVEEVARKLELELLNHKTLSGDDLESMQARLRDSEKRAYIIYVTYLETSKQQDSGFSVTTLEILERSYTRIAARRQSFEEKLPGIMEAKKKFCNTNMVGQIVSRAWISLCSQLDQLGYKMADKLSMKDALTIKALLDSETSQLRRATQEDLKNYLASKET